MIKALPAFVLENGLSIRGWLGRSFGDDAGEGCLRIIGIDADPPAVGLQNFRYDGQPGAMPLRLRREAGEEDGGHVPFRNAGSIVADREGVGTGRLAQDHANALAGGVATLGNGVPGVVNQIAEHATHFPAGNRHARPGRGDFRLKADSPLVAVRVLGCE